MSVYKDRNHRLHFCCIFILPSRSRLYHRIGRSLTAKKEIMSPATRNGSIYHGSQLTQGELLPPKHRAQRERLRYRNREVVILPALADGGERCSATRESVWASLVFSFYSFLRTIIVQLTDTNNKIMQSSIYITVALMSSWKGQCHEMNKFLKVLKFKSVLAVYASIVLYFFHLNCQEKYCWSSCLLLWKQSLILEILLEAASEFPVMSVIVFLLVFTTILIVSQRELGVSISLWFWKVIP